MKDFLHSVKFKILLYFVVLLAGFMTYAAAHGQLSVAPQELLASALVPLQRIGVVISGGLDGLRQRFIDTQQVVTENEQLREQLAQLREQMVDYDTIKEENKMYRARYQVEDTYAQYTTVTAFVIGRDPMEKYYAFTIDKGARDGIGKEDVVITMDGVVGKVYEVGPNYATVITVLDPQLSAGCAVSRTWEIGLAQGDDVLSLSGQFKMKYLARETRVASGDLVVTTGLGGVFPEGLILGTVETVEAESSGKSMYAVCNPTADIAGCTVVSVITDF